MARDLSARDYTVGTAAKASGVSSQTMRRLFDRGLIEGYRLAGSRHRRIPRAALERFMAARGIAGHRLTAPEGAPA